ncbi:MAG: hypothetical protein LC664_15160 [Flavobacteriales bacterium]|nr:hypothetical protein [Flavobacteriales bacterium]
MKKIHVLIAVVTFMMAAFSAKCQVQESEVVGKVVNGEYIITLGTDSIETGWEKLIPGVEILEISIEQRMDDEEKVFYLLLGVSDEGHEFGSPLILHGDQFTFEKMSGGEVKTIICSCVGSGSDQTVGCSIQKTGSEYSCSPCTGTCTKTESIVITK